jgi:hypothetical protein
MTTIVWQIEQLSCYPDVDNHIDVVFSAAWRVNGVDDTSGEPLYATVYGTQDIAPYDGKSPFIPYADLQEAIVIGWVQDAMGAEKVAAINANIEQQIENQVNPPVVTPPLPWITPSI